MSGIPGHTDVDRVREATDLVRLIGEHIPVKQRGREHVCICPFHDDHSPSMAIVMHKGAPFYKCHACGAGGDAFTFVMQYMKKDFREALQYLADRAGIALQPSRHEHAGDGAGDGRAVSRADLRDASTIACEFFRTALRHPRAGDAARGVLAERGLTDDLAERFMLGCAPDSWDALCTFITKRGLNRDAFVAAGLLKARRSSDGVYDAFRNRLMFPICDEFGKPIAFGARRIDPDDEPKYLNSSESAIFHKSRTLYGLHLAKRAIIDTKRAIITEGYTDVIACHRAGRCNVVGTLGTALTADHAELLSRLCDEVVLLFDGDEAGQRAADRAVEVFFAQPVDVKICVLPGGADPDDLLRGDGGLDAFDDAVGRAVDALAYKVSRFSARLRGTEGLSGRQKAIESFLAELSDLGFGAMQGVRKRLVLSHLSDLLDLSPTEIERVMPRPRRRRAAEPSGLSGPIASVDTPSPPSTAPAPPPWPDDAMPDIGRPTFTVTRALRLAEHDLLTWLIHDPALGVSTVVALDDRAATVPELFDAEQFHEPAARSVAEAVFALLAQQEDFGLGDLLARLSTSPDAAALATNLSQRGARLAGDDAERAREHLIEAARALDARRRMEAYEHNRRAAAPAAGADGDGPADPTADLLRRLEERKRQAVRPGAIPHGVRG